MLRELFVSVLILIVLVGGVSGQGAARSERLTLYGGVVLFANPAYDSLALAEFPFSLNRSELEFYQPMTEDSLYYARVFAQVDIYGPSGTIIDSASTFFSVRVPDLREASRDGYRLFNKLSIYLPPGLYTARLTVIDAVNKRRAEIFHASIEVIPPVKHRLNISDIYTAYDVTYVGDTSEGVDLRMVRNGYKVVPNPIATYTLEDTTVHIYAEAYNLSYAEDHPGEILVSLAVLNVDSSLHHNVVQRVLQNSGTSAVIAESFDIAGLSPAVYHARLIVVDQTNSQADTAFAPFQVIWRELLAAEVRNRKSSSDPYDSLSLESKVRLVTYQLTPPEKEALMRLGDRAKENYLDQYWKEHDEFPETPEVENRLELIGRFEDANRLFSTNVEKTDGWLSHLGRVLLKYGRPSKIEDNTAEWLDNPVQVWYYWEWEEGKFFIFEEKWKLHYDFVLVHSNVEGEVYDQDWQDVMDSGWIDKGINPRGDPRQDD